jgi:hypothetical protein
MRSAAPGLLPAARPAAAAPEGARGGHLPQRHRPQGHRPQGQGAQRRHRPRRHQPQRHRPQGHRPQGQGAQRRHRPQLLAALAVAIAVIVLATPGCGAGRNVLGTNTSPCFLALPVAKRAVAGRGKLAGVRMIDIPRLTATPGDRDVLALLGMLPAPPPRDVCLVAYAGSFTPGQVEQPAGLPPPGAGAGRYAIAVVTTPRSALLGTFVVRRLPLNFTHSRVGF